MTSSVANTSAVNTILRNKERVLHYLSLQKSKVEVMCTLGFNENDPQWAQNRQLLSTMFDGSANVEQIIGEISARRGLACSEVRELLTSLYVTGLLEFHITDTCDLNCIECHYRSKSLATFPFDHIETFITTLNPKAITITGGGEPTIRESGGTQELQRSGRMGHAKSLLMLSGAGGRAARAAAAAH